MREDPALVLRHMIQAFSTGETARADDFVAADYLDQQGIGGDAVHGPDGFRDVVRIARSSFTALDVSVEDVLVDGNRVAARLHWTGIRPDGGSVERETIEIVRVADGKAREHWGARLWATTLSS